VSRRVAGMNINELLKQKSMTKYELSKMSGLPQTTVSDICNGKVKIEKCTGETLYKLAKALNVDMEILVEDVLIYRPSFDAFKSNVCHLVKDMGDIDFIIETLEKDKVRRLWNRKWYPESLYTLAMVDYLSRINELPLCDQYDDLRVVCLEKIIYPVGIIVRCVASKSEQPKIDSYNNAIPEFKRFNIIENEVRNVI
jgi:transcriptional regulator with XRE-family HTH domain